MMTRGVAMLPAVVAAMGVLGAAPVCVAGGCDPEQIYGPPAVVPTNGEQLLSSAAADFDDDGVLDLVVGGRGGTDVIVLFGDGAGGFGAPTPVPAGATGPQAVEVADLNEDGDPDLIIGFWGASGSLSVVLGNGDGTFQEPTIFPVAGYATALAIGDVNGDDHLDVVTVVWNGDKVELLLGDGMGGLGVGQQFQAGQRPAGNNPAGLELADLDGDDDLDLAVTSGLNGSISVLLNQGGAFGPLTAFPTGGPSEALAVSDVDGDGDADLVATVGSDVEVLLNDGSGGFEAGQSFSAGVQADGLTAADVDGVNGPDLLVGSSGGPSLRLLLNAGDGTFGPPETIDLAPAAGPVAPMSIDVEGDGDPDLVTPTFVSGDVVVLSNECISFPPVIGVQPPAGSVVDEGEPFALGVVVALGTPPLSIQWRRNGVPLIDGEGISGATTDTLAFDAVSPANSDVYDVVIANASGEVISQTAVLAVRVDLPDCPADLSGNGVVDSADLNLILGEFGQPCP